MPVTQSGEAGLRSLELYGDLVTASRVSTRISIFDKRLFVFVEPAALFRFLNLAIGVEFFPQYNLSIHEPP